LRPPLLWGALDWQPPLMLKQASVPPHRLLKNIIPRRIDVEPVRECNRRPLPPLHQLRLRPQINLKGSRGSQALEQNKQEEENTGHEPYVTIRLPHPVWLPLNLPRRRTSLWLRPQSVSQEVHHRSDSETKRFIYGDAAMTSWLCNTQERKGLQSTVART
jgi:hypothetical protein